MFIFIGQNAPFFTPKQSHCSLYELIYRLAPAMLDFPQCRLLVPGLKVSLSWGGTMIA
jgi:hypothetical protein